MKKIIILAAFAITIASCEKMQQLNIFDKHKDKEQTPCPVVVSENLPSAVLTAFAEKYPGATVTTWFNKDNTGYCAVFTNNGVETKALFNNDGTFSKEEIETHQKGKHIEEDETGCECELEDHNHDGKH